MYIDPTLPGGDFMKLYCALRQEASMFTFPGKKCFLDSGSSRPLRPMIINKPESALYQVTCMYNVNLSFLVVLEKFLDSPLKIICPFI
jgi:hypothetical protein